MKTTVLILLLISVTLYGCVGTNKTSNSTKISNASCEAQGGICRESNDVSNQNNCFSGVEIKTATCPPFQGGQHDGANICCSVNTPSGTAVANPNVPTTTETSKPGTSNCHLYKNTRTGQINCFGCANGYCQEPEPGYEQYALPSGYIGVPYACTPGPQGCGLVQ